MGSIPRLALLIASTAALLGAQTPLKGSVERIKVHAKSLEGNLEEDSPDRDVSIYLPPSYGKTANARRYPVIYFLHGFTDDDERWFGFRQHWINLPLVLDKAMTDPARDMLVVMPNAYTRFQGSMYSNSVTTGNWEEFVARELVAYIDSHYATLAVRDARGLAGHSMGGYGTMRIGMKHPDVFSAIYALSPCCMIPAANLLEARSGNPSAEAVHSFEDVAKADFGIKAALASAAAWSPNPKNPPLFLDLPTQGEKFRADVVAKWSANAPLAMLDQYLSNLRLLRAIAFDAGAQDTGIAATVKTLDERLNQYGLPHTFEIYEGNHTNHVADRIETSVVPFFASALSARPR